MKECLLAYCKELDEAQQLKCLSLKDHIMDSTRNEGPNVYQKLQSLNCECVSTHDEESYLSKDKTHPKHNEEL
jgi:hypothetical protein